MPANKLKQYQEKRDFERTAEPSGNGKVVTSDARRFVIQKHAASHLHYDLRLEFDGIFRSWAVPKERSPDRKSRPGPARVQRHS
jgi:bifunctional non-homologous end joining protein LigD